MNDLVPINAEELRRLRRNGQAFEADQLLRAYRKNCKRQKAQEVKETLAVQRKKCAAYGICNVCMARNARPGRLSCEHCAEYQKRRPSK
jgi:hypothetical protein